MGGEMELKRRPGPPGGCRLDTLFTVYSPHGPLWGRAGGHAKTRSTAGPSQEPLFRDFGDVRVPFGGQWGAVFSG